MTPSTKDITTIGPTHTSIQHDEEGKNDMRTIRLNDVEVMMMMMMGGGE